MPRPLSRLIPPSLTRSSHHSSSSAPLDIHTLLSEPTWSIRSLLPPHTTTTTSTTTTTPLTPSLITHLHRLSALPPPTTPSQLSQISNTLRSQLHFVQHVQSVDTTDTPPLFSIRDETAQGLADQAAAASAALKTALDAEETVGKCRRPRRRRGGEARQQQQQQEEEQEAEGWDVLGSTGGEKVGRYFVVRSGKGQGQGQAQGS